MLAPIGSNATDDGRAKNPRIRVPTRRADPAKATDVPTSWRARAREKYGADPTVTYFESPVVVDNVAQQVLSDA
ncbi:hypothetical protein [Bradyrhizobium sp. th.b2]|uniref:hypothetical protein n=1 Tax=Bradyrhizobium sp. th-b2 TaxID=172088 RepID=UPI00041ACF17|nr:hypothetical protein [Bradyrhizobium sp. th.b2]